MNHCRLEIEAEPWMEGVLNALLSLLTPSVILSVAGDNCASTEVHLPSVQASDIASRPASDHSVSEKLNQLDLNNDNSDNRRMVECLSNVRTTESQSASCANADSKDVSSVSDQTSIQPKNEVPPTSINVEKVIDSEDDFEESLTHSLPPLSTVPLTVPLCPPRFLKLSFLPDEQLVSAVFHSFAVYV